MGAEWFPGYEPSPPRGTIEAPALFGPADEQRLWLLDFHWPRGLTPLGLTTFARTYAASSQRAARQLRLPGSGGMSVRLVGPHLYISARPADPAKWTERDEHGEAGSTFSGRASGGLAVPAAVDRRLRTFRSRWRRRAALLDYQAAALLGGPEPTSPAQALSALRAARRHESWAWQVHFEEMYTLLAGHLRYRATLAALGVERELADACLAGRPTRTGEAHAVLAALAQAWPGLPAAERATRIGKLIDSYGWRSEGIADVSLPSWKETPGLLRGRIEQLARSPGHLRADSQPAEVHRQRAVEAARAAARDRRAFDRALAQAEEANWIWWNEEHNALIDLRASLPLRRAARAAAAFIDQPPDSVVLLAWEELIGALTGRGLPLQGLLDERAAWLDGWRARRSEMVAFRGAPTSLTAVDPVLTEIFGLSEDSCAGNHHANQPVEVLAGVGASGGITIGPARVMRSAAELDALNPGEVLVCEATSPNWSPAFLVAGAVVCEHGGYTTHAATIARELRLPCVVGVPGATVRIRTGQLVEVDGDKGTVRAVA